MAYRTIILTAFIVLLKILVLAQQNVGVGTTTPNPSAKLDVTATDKGILIPRMTTAQRLAIVNPANSLLVYDTDVDYYFYCWNFLGRLNNELNHNHSISNDGNHTHTIPDHTHTGTVTIITGIVPLKPDQQMWQ